MTRKLIMAGMCTLWLAGCGDKPADQEPTETTTQDADTTTTEITVTDVEIAGNPLLDAWDTPFGLPPFADVKDEHYMPAVKKGILELRAEIDQIANNTDAPSFENTIVALESSGRTLTRVARVFSNITATELNDTLKGLQVEIWPMFSREQDAINLNDTLFQRVQSVYAKKDQLGLSEQDARLLELTHRDFVRAGAALAPEIKTQVADINAEIAELTTKFGQNLLAATKAFKLTITDEADLAGLSADFKAALWNADESAWIVGLNRSVYETFMTQSENRELREKLFNGYRLRASAGESDNGPLAIRIAQLRAKRAKLLGYESHAHYQLETRMAKTPAIAEDFLKRVWAPGLEKAKQEKAEIQELIGDEFELQGHDWWHYSERVRQAKYAFDNNALKPYFELEAVRSGAFEMARRLFSVTFNPVDVPVWNPNVTAYEVVDNAGAHVGLFMMDMYARDSKRGGAWMSNYRGAWKMGDDVSRPIVTNNLNLTTPSEGSPTLMNFTEVETLFHEFGHGLHGLLTRVNYASFSGVDGPRDYTEFPAQILEHWAPEPEMLALYAKHNETGEIIPGELIEKMRSAANFNQGFKTTEFIAASLLDLRWHMLTEAEANQITDARAFESKVLKEYGLLDEIEPRYRSNYFSHIFAGGYSAGYYAYLWSEILDADGFQTFKEAEDIFHPETAARLKKWIYESGGLREADELYRNFRGADPSIEPLLRGRGFPTDGKPTS